MSSSRTRPGRGRGRCRGGAGQLLSTDTTRIASVSARCRATFWRTCGWPIWYKVRV